MAKRANRVDTSQRRDELTDNPFAALGDTHRDDLPPGPGQSEQQPVETPSTPVYRVMRTRKGRWPLQVEKRAAGKVVTVVSHVEGDAKALLSALRKQCGSGGVAREGRVEVQGDHRERIEAFLNEM